MMEDFETETEKQITENIQLLTELMKVNSDLKKNVTSDYTLAFLDAPERDFVTENYQNAEFAKELINRYSMKGYYYKFDDTKLDWVRDESGLPEQINISMDARKLILLKGSRIFTFFMIQSHMIAILNRNKSTNFLVKLLGKDNDDEKPVQFDNDDRSLLKKIGDNITGKERISDED